MDDGRFLVWEGGTSKLQSDCGMGEGRFLVCVCGGGGLQSDCGIWMMIKVMPAGAVVVRK